jgi:predicted naringenin-chalcone synthase
MTWHITDLGFRMGLSSEVPEILSRHVDPFVRDLLAGHGLAVPDVATWAIHPGGPRILDVAQERLGLSDDALAASRDCLAAHGNCSSPTVLLILERLLGDTPPAGSPMLLMAFGPGLTLYAALLT